MLTVALIALACGFLYILDRMHSNDDVTLGGVAKFATLGAIVAGGAIWAYNGQPPAVPDTVAKVAEDVFTGLPQF